MEESVIHILDIHIAGRSDSVFEILTLSSILMQVSQIVKEILPISRIHWPKSFNSYKSLGQPGEFQDVYRVYQCLFHSLGRKHLYYRPKGFPTNHFIILSA